MVSSILFICLYQDDLGILQLIVISRPPAPWFLSCFQHISSLFLTLLYWPLPSNSLCSLDKAFDFGLPSRALGSLSSSSKWNNPPQQDPDVTADLVFLVGEFGQHSFRELGCFSFFFIQLLSITFPQGLVLGPTY